MAHKKQSTTEESMTLEVKLASLKKSNSYLSRVRFLKLILNILSVFMERMEREFVTIELTSYSRSKTGIKKSGSTKALPRKSGASS